MQPFLLHLGIAYVVFIRVADGKIAFIREYFDPVRAAKAMRLSIAVWHIGGLGIILRLDRHYAAVGGVH